MRLKRRPHATIEGAVRVSAAPVIEAGGREHFLMIAGTKHRGVDSPRAGSYLSPMDTPDQIPDHVRNAFAARPFMDLTALARALQWDLSTLRGHVDAGKLVGRRKGHGKVRTHLVFTIEDFRQFWERLAEPVATPTVLPSPRKRQRAKPRQGGKELMAQRRGKAAGRSVRRRR
jgi:hypothetical protein